MDARSAVPLVRVAYASAASRRIDREELLQLLAKAREKNARLGVTGILLYVDDSFFQVLEGPLEAVTGIYARIEQDDRHSKVLKLIQEPITERAFPDWSMGMARVSREDLASIPGLNDFFRTKSALSELPPSRARTLLQAFSDGRWRASVL